MPQDNLRPPGEALFKAFGACARGHPYDEVLSAAMNIILNGVRQNVARRDSAIDLMTELHERSMNALLEHYDVVTNRRRSVIPFDQVISAGHTTFKSGFPPLGGGGKNGRS